MMPGARRFWLRATVAPDDDAHTVHLDVRKIMTPARRPLRVPSRALAAAIAEEWNAVEETLRPDAMPMTRAANTSIDGVLPDPAPIVDMLAGYGGTDLICYRAEAPAGLRARQFAGWDPMLAWSAEALGAPLVAVMGVMHVPQPKRSLAALREAVAAHDPFELTALSELVTITGSLVLALAVARGAIDGPTAWRISQIDEDWQEQQWGRDEEAAAAAALRRQALLNAERYLRLLREQDAPGEAV